MKSCTLFSTFPCRTNVAHFSWYSAWFFPGTYYCIYVKYIYQENTRRCTSKSVPRCVGPYSFIQDLPLSPRPYFTLADRILSIFRGSLSCADRIVLTNDHIHSFMTVNFTYDENICWRAIAFSSENASSDMTRAFFTAAWFMLHEAYDKRLIVWIIRYDMNYDSIWAATEYGIRLDTRHAPCKICTTLYEVRHSCEPCTI